MSTAGDIVVNLTANSRGFDHGCKTAEHSLESLAHSVEMFKGAFLGFLGFEGIKGTVETIKGAAEKMADAGATAKTIGASSEFVSELGFAAKMSHVSMDDLATSLKKMEKNLGEAALGNGEKLTEMLSRVGTTAADLQAMGPEKAFSFIADAASRIVDPMQKAAFATEVFGRGGQSMIPLLNKGKAGIAALREEAQRLGVSFGGEMVSKSAEAMHAFHEIEAAADGLKATLAVALAPTFSDTLAPAIVGATLAMNDFAKAQSGVDDAGNKVGELGTAFAGLADITQTIAKGWNLLKLAVTDTCLSINTGILGIAKAWNAVSDAMSVEKIPKWMLPRAFNEGGGEASFKLPRIDTVQLEKDQKNLNDHFDEFEARRKKLNESPKAGDRIKDAIKGHGKHGEQPEIPRGPDIDLGGPIGDMKVHHQHVSNKSLDVFSKEGFSTIAKAFQGPSVNVNQQQLAEAKKANINLEKIDKGIQNIQMPAVGPAF